MKKSVFISAVMIVSLLIGVGQNSVNALSGTENTSSLSPTSQYSTSTTDSRCLITSNNSGVSLLYGTTPTQTISYGGITNDSHKVVSPDYTITRGDTLYVSGADYSGTISVQGASDGSNYLNTLNTSETTLVSRETTDYSLYKATLDNTTSISISPVSSAYPKISNTFTDNCSQQVTPVLPTPSVSLTVEGTGVAYAEYGQSVTLDWDSVGMESCNLEPIGRNGIEGEYVLQDVTANVTVTINCTISAGYAKIQITPPTVSIKALPPTYDYLKSYINQLQADSSKKLNLTGVLQLIDQSKRMHDSGKLIQAQSLLQQSAVNLKKQLNSKQVSQAAITKYETASNYLSKTLPVQIELALNGCSVTAKGAPGLILEYGANYQMKKGYGEQVTIPASGAVTVPIYAPTGHTATGEIIDSTGLIYGRNTKNVATSECPSAPFYQDISQNNGYPDKWALPAPQTLIDDWGFYNRTPESYIAFRLAESGRLLPAGYGDVSNWLEKATADNYIVDVPRPGDIAINTDINNTSFSTAEYVNSVDLDGGVRTSSISSAGNFWAAGVTGGSWYNMKYIRIP